MYFKGVEKVLIAILGRSVTPSGEEAKNPELSDPSSIASTRFGYALSSSGLQ